MASTDPLSRLVTTLSSSLPMYLGDSGVQTYPGDGEIRSVLERLVEEGRDLVARAATILEEREVAVPRRGYPMSFTAFHDIDLGHLLPRLVADLRRQAEACTAIAASAGDRDAAASSLAGEAAAVTKRHLDALERITGRKSTAVSPPQPAKA